MSTKISKVLKKSFPELNIDWLMHGQGEMVYQNETRNIHTEPIDIALLIIELSQIEATLDLIRKSVQRIRNQITIKLKE